MIVVDFDQHETETDGMRFNHPEMHSDNLQGLWDALGILPRSHFLEIDFLRAILVRLACESNQTNLSDTRYYEFRAQLAVLEELIYRLLAVGDEGVVSSLKKLGQYILNSMEDKAEDHFVCVFARRLKDPMEEFGKG